MDFISSLFGNNVSDLEIEKTDLNPNLTQGRTFAAGLHAQNHAVLPYSQGSGDEAPVVETLSGSSQTDKGLPSMNNMLCPIDYPFLSKHPQAPGICYNNREKADSEFGGAYCGQWCVLGDTPTSVKSGAGGCGWPSEALMCHNATRYKTNNYYLVSVANTDSFGGMMVAGKQWLGYNHRNAPYIWDETNHVYIATPPEDQYRLWYNGGKYHGPGSSDSPGPKTKGWCIGGDYRAGQTPFLKKPPGNRSGWGAIMFFLPSDDENNPVGTYVRGDTYMAQHGQPGDIEWTNNLDLNTAWGPLSRIGTMTVSAPPAAEGPPHVRDCPGESCDGSEGFYCGGSDIDQSSWACKNGKWQELASLSGADWTKEFDDLKTAAVRGVQIASRMELGQLHRAEDQVNKMAQELKISWSKPLYETNGINVGRDAFNAAFRASDGIIKRTCSDCNSTHSTVYYKRLTDLQSFDAYNHMIVTWSNENNVLGTDFNLYSSESDMLADRNAWTYCNYGDPDVGFARDCGPSGPASDQWNSNTNKYNAGRNVKFFVGNITTSGLVSDSGFITAEKKKIAEQEAVLADTKKSLDGAKGVVARQSSELKDIQTELSGERTQFWAVAGAIKTGRSQLEQELKDVEATTASISSLTATIADVTSKVAKLKASNEKLKEENSAENSEISSAADTLAHAAQKTAELKTKLAKLSATLASKKAILARDMKAENSEAGIVSTKKAQLARLEAATVDSKAEVQKLTESLSQLTASLHDVQAAGTGIQGQISRIRASVKTLNEEIEEIVHANDDMHTTLVELRPMITGTAASASSALGALAGANSARGPVSTYEASTAVRTTSGLQRAAGVRENDPLYKEYVAAVKSFDEFQAAAAGNEEKPPSSPETSKAYMNLQRLATRIKLRMDPNDSLAQDYDEGWAGSLDDVQSMMASYQSFMDRNRNVSDDSMQTLSGLSDTSNLQMGSSFYNSVLWLVLTVVLVGLTAHFMLFGGYTHRNILVMLVLSVAGLYILYSFYRYVMKHQLIIR